MTIFLITILLFVAASGTAVVFTRDPARQAVGVSFMGMILAIMFMVFQEADVSLSQIVIGAVGLPLMILLALAKLRRDAQLAEKQQNGKER
jgi:energy-converting hydrogenase B subunit D